MAIRLWGKNISGPWVTTTEPVGHNYRRPCALEPMFYNKRSHPNETPAPPLGKSLGAHKDPAELKINT